MSPMNVANVVLYVIAGLSGTFGSMIAIAFLYALATKDRKGVKVYGICTLVCAAFLAAAVLLANA